MSNKSLTPILLLLMCQQLIAADAPPEAEIFLLDLSVDNSAPVNISQHPGYDNQPAFSADGQKIYYSRSDNNQTDIWYYDLPLQLQIRLTKTPESEYSPQPAPHEKSLSVVQVTMDGAQHFTLLDLDSGDFKVLAKELSTIGYYNWYSGGSAALFLLPEPFELRLYASEGEQLSVATRIGRALATHPESGQLLYVDKSSEPWKIMAFSPPDSKTEVANLFLDQEDFAISSSGTLWTTMGSKIYQRQVTDDRWQLVTDLRGYGLENLSRLAVSPDESKLALVNSK